MKESMLTNVKFEDLLEKFPYQKGDDHGSRELVKRLYTLNGEDYYCAKEGFCFQTPEGITVKGSDLTRFEWEGNEIFISEEETGQVVQAALMTVKQLAGQLLESYPGLAFDIFLSFDVEDSNLPPSATIRFYKVREGNHIVMIDEMDDYEQPVGMYQLPGEVL